MEMAGRSSSSSVSSESIAQSDRAVRQEAVLVAIADRAEIAVRLTGAVQSFVQDLRQAQQNFQQSLSKVSSEWRDGDIENAGNIGSALRGLSSMVSMAETSSQQFATSLSAHVVPPLTQAKAFLEAESRAIRAETRRLSQHLRKQREAVQDALHQLRRACAAVETGEVSVDPWLADLRLRDTLKVLEHEEKVVASNIGVLYARLEQLDIRATGRLKDSIFHILLEQRDMSSKLLQQANQMWDSVYSINAMDEYNSFCTRVGLNDPQLWSPLPAPPPLVPSSLTAAIKVGILRRPTKFKQEWKDHVAVLTACGQLHLFGIKPAPNPRQSTRVAPLVSASPPPFLSPDGSSSNVVSPTGSEMDVSLSLPELSAPPSSEALSSAAAPPPLSAVELLLMLDDIKPLLSLNIQGGWASIMPQGDGDVGVLDVLCIQRQKPLFAREAHFQFQARSPDELEEWAVCINARADVSVGYSPALSSASASALHASASDDSIVINPLVRSRSATVRTLPPPEDPRLQVAAPSATPPPPIPPKPASWKSATPTEERLMAPTEFSRRPSLDEDGGALPPPRPPRLALLTQPGSAQELNSALSALQFMRSSSSSSSQELTVIGETDGAAGRSPAQSLISAVPKGGASRAEKKRAATEDPSVLRASLLMPELAVSRLLGGLLEGAESHGNNDENADGENIYDHVQMGLEGEQGQEERSGVLPRRPDRVGSSMADDGNWFFFNDDRSENVDFGDEVNPRLSV